MEKEFDLEITLEFFEEEEDGIEVDDSYVEMSLADSLREIANMIEEGDIQGIGVPGGCNWYLQKIE